MTDQPSLFPLGLLEPVDPSSQIDRMPGVDAVCVCTRPACSWPFCDWKTHERKDAA